MERGWPSIIARPDEGGGSIALFTGLIGDTLHGRGTGGSVCWRVRVSSQLCGWKNRMSIRGHGASGLIRGELIGEEIVIIPTDTNNLPCECGQLKGIGRNRNRVGGGGNGCEKLGGRPGNQLIGVGRTSTGGRGGGLGKVEEEQSNLIMRFA